MDIHFNSYKVKYDILNQSLKPIFNSRPIRTVNIFINLDDVFHKLHRPLVNNEFQVSGDNAYKQLISNTLNLLAHYRRWVISRFNCKCKVYAIYTSYKGQFTNENNTIRYRKKFHEIK